MYWTIEMGFRASILMLGVWCNGWEALLNSSVCRLSVSVAGSVTAVTVRWRPRPEQAGRDVGRRPALSGLSIRPLNSRHHPIAY